MQAGQKVAIVRQRRLWVLKILTLPSSFPKMGFGPKPLIIYFCTKKIIRQKNRQLSVSQKFRESAFAPRYKQLLINFIRLESKI